MNLQNNLIQWARNIKANIWSGVTVALISLPLSIALAIASGGTPIMGIITGVWATGFAALFGSSNYNIVGVAGALSTVLFTAAASMAGVSPAATLTLLAICTGIIILCIYVLKLDQYLKYIPASVMYGFATGVAVLIAAGQLFDALGLTVKKGAEFIHNMELLARHITEIYWPAFIIFAIFLGLLLLWKRFIKKLPGVIPMSILGIVVGYVTPKFFPNINLVRLVDKFGDLKAQMLVTPDLDGFGAIIGNPEYLMLIIKTSLLVALIAVLETLITARIGDRMTKTEHNPRQELFGLGIANIVSGFVGGLPSTGVFIRTGANIKAGATHRASQLIAALVTAAMAVVIMPLFKFLPMAVIAAILFNTAIGLLEIHAFKQYWKEERSSFWIALMVTIITITRDAGVAVIIGVIIGVFILIHRLSQDMVTVWFNKNGTALETRRGKAVVSLEDCPQCDTIVYSIAGFLNYLDINQHIMNIKNLIERTGAKHLVIRMRDVYQIDLESVETLAPFVNELITSGIVVDISSAHDEVLDILTKDPGFSQLREGNHFFEKTSQALAHQV